MIAKLARAIDEITAKPEATLIALLLVIAWGVAGPLMRFSGTWLSIGGALSGVPPFVLVFALANAARADTRALQAKLDGLIAAIEPADNALIGLEKKPPKEFAAVCEPDKVVPPRMTTPNGFGM